MKPQIISNSIQYKEILVEVERLILADPSPNSAEGHRLTTLSILVENYEKDRFRFERPSPLEAIRFRMEEENLRQVDLIPYFGSSAKVSEILSGKRPLTLSIIRKLSEGLKIPAEILIQPTIIQQHEQSPEELVWTRFPLAEMRKRKWIKTSPAEIKRDPKAIMEEFLTPLGGNLFTMPLCRSSLRTIDTSEKAAYALRAWAAQVMIYAEQLDGISAYDANAINEDFRKKLAQFSVFEEGPSLARTFLAQQGISLVIVPHLKNTKLDGAALLLPSGKPVIGLTLRYDRLDNFWFVLMHELVHIEKHLKQSTFFYDDLDSESSERIELQADQLSLDSFIPRTEWRASEAYNTRSIEAIERTAAKYRINKAIVAGRLRKELNDYKLFSDLVGTGAVRCHFPEYMNN